MGRSGENLVRQVPLFEAKAYIEEGVDPASHAALIDAWDRLQPWPEAARAIAGVKAKGYPVAILSNGDEDMLDPAYEPVFERPSLDALPSVL